MMPQVNIERARVIGTPKIDLDASANAATVQCRGIIIATIKQSGHKGGGDDQVVLTFVRSGDRWLLEDYRSNRKWDRALGR